MKKIVMMLLGATVLFFASVAWADVQVVIDRRSTDNHHWLESAKVMKNIIEADDNKEYIIRRSDFFQVIIAADIHSNGRDIITVVQITRRGEKIDELIYSPILFADNVGAAQNGEIIGRSVKKRLEELERICRLSYEQLE